MDESKEELLEVIMDMVNQHCQRSDGTLDSMALTDNAYAMRLLAKHGKLKIISEYGRRVIGKWIPQPEEE